MSRAAPQRDPDLPLSPGRRDSTGAPGTGAYTRLCMQGAGGLAAPPLGSGWSLTQVMEATVPPPTPRSCAPGASVTVPGRLRGFGASLARGLFTPRSFQPEPVCSSGSTFHWHIGVQKAPSAGHPHCSWPSNRSLPVEPASVRSHPCHPSGHHRCLASSPKAAGPSTPSPCFPSGRRLGPRLGLEVGLEAWAAEETLPASCLRLPRT